MEVERGIMELARRYMEYHGMIGEVSERIKILNKQKKDIGDQLMSLMDAKSYSYVQTDDTHRVKIEEVEVEEKFEKVLLSLIRRAMDATQMKEIETVAQQEAQSRKKKKRRLEPQVHSWSSSNSSKSSKS